MGLPLAQGKWIWQGYSYWQQLAQAQSLLSDEKHLDWNL
jgi:hypothetical protein